MVLYKFLFPQQSICNEQEMYYRGNGIDPRDHKILFKNGGYVVSSTYFNSISLNKWYENTISENIGIRFRLKGSFDIQLGILYLQNGKVKTEWEQALKRSSENDYTVELFFNKKNGIGFFKLTALSDNAVFYGAEYFTDVDPSLTNPVKLAVGICTFRREEFILANLSRLSEAINNKESILYNNLDVYVSDNGQTLPLSLNDDHIRITYNPNYGGAGGFTRTVIEAKLSQKEYTNFIFLDDDILLDAHAIEKNAAFLSLLKPEKRKSVIGGAMFSTEKKYWQFESASKWQDIGFRFNRRDVDLRLIENVVLNEQPYDVNYNAWCYCCIPFEIAKNNNLPIPIFFHMDDVEYGLRNGLPVITLNGINVWHLYKKGIVPAKNIYYDIRNKLIMLSEINPDAAIRLAWSYFVGFTTEVLKYHYAKAINAYLGILDFCKGFDWFKKTNTLSIHQSLFNNVNWTDTTDEAIKRAAFSQSDVRTRKAKLAIAKNQLLPSFKTKYIFDDNSMEDTKNCRKIIVVSKSERKQIVYKKSLRLAFKCFFMRQSVKRALKKKLPSAVAEYNMRLSEVQSLSFWNDYLGLSLPKKPRKVLFVASDNDATSGAFRSMTVLCRLMKEEHNIDAKVLLPKVGDGVKLLRENDIEYTIIPSEDWIVKMNDDPEAIRQKKRKCKENNEVALKKIKDYLVKEQFDLVHINTTYHYVAALAAQALSIPIVWHLREFLEEDQQRRILDRDFGYNLIKQSTKIIAISDSIFDKYKEVFGKEKMIRIYNGIDPAPFYSSEHEILTNDKPSFVCIGVIDSYKGQGELVEACGKYKERYGKDFKLTLIGNERTAYMKTVNDLIQQYSLQKNVVIAGRRSDVNDILKKTDVTFVCSKAEAFGRVTIEAMMSGSVVIGANSAGTKELICDHIDGLLYSSGNTDELCEKIHECLEATEKTKAMAKAGNQKAMRQFSAKNNCDNVFNVYQSIWEGK